MKEQVRQIVLSLGADLCGFAQIERFCKAPEGFHPTDIFSDCKTVIAYALALPKGLAKVAPRLIYGHYNTLSTIEADRIAFHAANKIEAAFQCKAVPMPCDAPYEYWDEAKMEGRGMLSMRHAAALAGLGTIGQSGMLLTKRYGSMVTLGAILIDLELPSDAQAEEQCIPQCRSCVNACPAHAISNGVVDQKRCRENTFGKTARGFGTVDCNQCRTACPRNK